MGGNAHGIMYWNLFGNCDGLQKGSKFVVCDVNTMRKSYGVWSGFSFCDESFSRIRSFSSFGPVYQFVFAL